jgi:hypothetical protein
MELRGDFEAWLREEYAKHGKGAPSFERLSSMYRQRSVDDAWRAFKAGALWVVPDALCMPRSQDDVGSMPR